MRVFAGGSGRGLLPGALVFLCVCLGGAGAAEGKRLSVSLPEVVVESPDIERLIASRVRPRPPGRLGVRLPAVFIEPEIPPVRLPPRPLPREEKPKPGGLARFLFADESDRFGAALANLRKGAPIEALSLFEELAGSAKRPRWRAAALFWAGEALARLRKGREASAARERLLRMPLNEESFRYAAAARYALAGERCGARDYPRCLALLEGGTWVRGKFAYEEAVFLKGWAQARAGSVKRAIDAWAGLAGLRERLALRALVALGHVRLARGEYARAEMRYAAADALAAKGDAAGARLPGEALYGLGWARLLSGRIADARRAFARFARRHPKHPLENSARAALLSAEIEAMRKPRGKPGEWESRLRGFAGGGREAPAGALRLQLAWKLFRVGAYEEASDLAGEVSDEFPLGRIYRAARIVEGLARYHLGEVKRAYGVLRLGAERAPAGAERRAERGAARSAAMATAFAAFRLKDFGGARDVLRRWAFAPGKGGGAARDGLAALWYGEAAFELGELAEAARAFRAVPEGAPEFYRALGGLAWIQYRRRNWKAAARAFDRVFRREPGGVLAAEALARAGEARFNLGNYEGALRSFERIEKKYRGSGVAREALYQKAKLLFRRGRFGAARKSLRAFLKRYPKGGEAAEARYLLALIPLRLGRYAEARAKLRAFLRSHGKSPFSGDAHLRMADASYNEGRYREASRLYRLMMRRHPSHPKFPEAVYGGLISHLQLGERESFLSGAHGYIDRYPESSLSISLAFQIGEVFLARGSREEALKAYRDVIARYPRDDLAAHALLRIADIYRSGKDVDKALDSYEALLTRDAGGAFRADGLFGIGETLAGIGRCAEARRRLEEFLRAHPRHDYEMLARLILGRCLVRLGEGGAALSRLGKVMAEGSGAGPDLRAQAALLAGGVHRKRKEYAEAARALSAAIELGAPGLAAEAFFARAGMLRERGDPRAAAEYLKLTYLYPDQKMWAARALERAGALYEKAGKRAMALRVYEKMEKTAGDAALRRKARIALKRVRRRAKGGRER